MIIRQSPSGPRIAFGLVARDFALKEGDPQTIVPATPTIVTTTGAVELVASYDAKANHTYYEQAIGYLDCSNAAAAGTDTWLGELLRSVDGGATWTNVTAAQTRETETALATQSMVLPQTTPESFTPTEDTTVLFALRLTGATSNVSCLTGNAKIQLEVWE